MVLIKCLMQDCGSGQFRMISSAVPCLADSSALSFPHSPEWAAIQRSSTVLLEAMVLIAARQSATVLLWMGLRPTGSFKESYL